MPPAYLNKYVFIVLSYMFCVELKCLKKIIGFPVCLLDLLVDLEGDGGEGKGGWGGGIWLSPRPSVERAKNGNKTWKYIKATAIAFY